MTSSFLIDDAALQKLVFHYRSDILTSIAKAINLLFGFHYGLYLAGACAILILIFKTADRWIAALYSALVVAFCVLINPQLKLLIARSRPGGKWLISESGFSFPSGHSIFAVALIGGLFLILASSLKNLVLQIFLGVLAVLLVLIIMLSRVYLGVHYPSDILAGGLLGSSVLHLTYPLYYKLTHRRKTRHQR